MRETEVCVIGGGPAGAVCAKRLAELGHRVLVVERHRFPRPHVGEALTPGIWPLFEVLGLRRTMESAGFRTVTEARVRWAEDEPRHVRFPTDAPGLTVDRGRFDQLLLDAARSAGADVLQPAVARRPRRTVEGAAAGWEVPLSTDGGPVTVRARFLVDAGGRAFVLGGDRRPTAPRTVALHATWRGVPRDSTPTRVDAGADAWFWGTLLPDGAFRAMVLTDAEALRRSGVRKPGLERFYRGLLAGSELLDGLADARLESPVAVCDASGYADPDPVTTDSIKLGEAAFALDPLSSSGVDKAMQTAMAGSTTVHTLLSGVSGLSGLSGDGAAALAFYRENQRYAVEQHATWTANYYHEHRRHRDRPFWRRRARPPEPSPAPPPPLRLSSPVRLADSCTLVDTPCAVGDRVEVRRALSHPDLPRPVAYLGGAALAPLVESLGSGQRLDDLLRGWSRHLPFDQALGVAQWLHRQGLLTNHVQGPG